MAAAGSQTFISQKPSPKGNISSPSPWRDNTTGSRTQPYVVVGHVLSFHILNNSPPYDTRSGLKILLLEYGHPRGIELYTVHSSLFRGSGGHVSLPYTTSSNACMVSLAVGEAAATENIFEYRHCLGIEDASAVVRVCLSSHTCHLQRLTGPLQK